jgi:hypothetical protein
VALDVVDRLLGRDAPLGGSVGGRVLKCVAARSMPDLGFDGGGSALLGGGNPVVAVDKEPALGRLVDDDRGAASGVCA